MSPVPELLEVAAHRAGPLLVLAAVALWAARDLLLSRVVGQRAEDGAAQDGAVGAGAVEAGPAGARSASAVLTAVCWALTGAALLAIVVVLVGYLG